MLILVSADSSTLLTEPFLEEFGELLYLKLTVEFNLPFAAVPVAAPLSEKRSASLFPDFLKFE